MNLTIHKVILLFLFVAALFLITGCKESALVGDNLILIDFKADTPLKYRFVSDRKFTIQLEQGKKSFDEMSEKLEMVISYKPVGEPNPYGLTTVEATIDSAKVTRDMSNRPPKDVVETLAGKSYTFTVSPTGEIAEVSELFELAAELGEAAILDSGKQGRIKNPDMISDFVAMQLYLWDAAASAEQTVDGLRQGDTWKSKQYIPLPVPIGFVKDVTYNVESADGENSDARNEAAITSTFSPGEGKLEKWPKIYSGNFNMRGPLGVLRNFRLKSVDGKGEDIFDLDNGVLVKKYQEYNAEVEAMFLFPLPGTSPKLTVDQKFTVELMDD